VSESEQSFPSRERVTSCSQTSPLDEEKALPYRVIFWREKKLAIGPHDSTGVGQQQFTGLNWTRPIITLNCVNKFAFLMEIQHFPYEVGTE
jgi:hypothetical protein